MTPRGRAAWVVPNGGDGTVVLLAYSSDRRLGLAWVPKLLFTRRYADETFAVQG